MGPRAALPPPLPTAETPETSNLLGSLWQKYLPLMRERLLALDGAASAVQEGTFDAGQRNLALDAAHKFAGSLGMFGYAEGTEVARSLEHLLLESEAPDEVRLQSLIGRLHTVLNL